jgi:uncharacterized protein YbaR (Trm112 family)
LNFRVKSATLKWPASSRKVVRNRLVLKVMRAMLRNELYDILRCPENQATLLPADVALVAELNARIRAGRLRNKAGRDVHERIDGGLVRADGDLLYPIVEQIPVLLRDEAIPLDQLDK